VKREQIRFYNIRNKTKHRMIRRLKRANRKEEYQSMAADYVVTFSNGALDDETALAYLQKAFRFFKYHFDGFEIISAAIHFDEATPHLHLRVSYFNVDLMKFQQDTAMKAGLTDINHIRDEFQRLVADGFNLRRQDGGIVSAHDGPKALQAKATERTIKAMAEELEALREELQYYRGHIHTNIANIIT
jgi:hypothetical protein